MANPTLCIYHHDCTDGFAAAWAVRKFFCGFVDFHPGIYGEDPPDVTNRSVIIADFSYKRETLLEMATNARRIKIFDHHKTSQEDLIDLPNNVQTVFDTTRSGSMITWQELFIGELAPLLFHHIEDYDLHKFKLPMTAEVIAAVESYPRNFQTWNTLIEKPILELEREGRPILRQHKNTVDRLIEEQTRWVHFGDHPIPTANVPHMYANDVAGRLAEGNPFAAIYYDDEHGRKWSLRSAHDGIDVSEIAKAFGGGGHKHSAGFRMTRYEAINFERKGGAA